jgi:glyoxylase-like metal-dependent hydrolase (beta-lactamase superfamily II)
MAISSIGSIEKKIFSVAPGVWGMRDVFVNFYMIQNTTDDNWVLVDAGLKWSSGKIKRMANYLFGENAKPSAIILTHGHFDHVGSLQKLAEEWDVPVFAHYMEIPYLTGRAAYQPADSSVGGGMMAYMAWLYPSSPINIWNRVNVLPGDGTIPVLDDWKYIHTPGHAPGHISLFRESDKALIAGDAFVTTCQESAISVATQKKKISGPPKYFTYDWNAAERSVQELAALQPKVAATGHGKPMRGAELRDSLLTLSQHFEEVAVPSKGRYLDDPAVADANGFIYIPESDTNNTRLAWKAGAVSALAVLTILLLNQKKKRKKKIETGNLLDFEYNF